MPEISVIMGTCNEKNRKYVAMAIDSILRQTFSDFELIICDDGSSPGFYRWLRGYCSRDKRIRLLRNKDNRGLAAALNRCLSCASGQYIARMDADDISTVGRLQKQWAFLEGHKAYALAGTNAGLICGRHIWGERRMERVPGKESFLKTSPFIHPSILIRREVVRQLHGYCEHPKARRVEDYEFFMRLYAAGYQGFNLQEPLLLYREDLGSYGRRKYRYRINECRVRYQGFLRLGILKGNLRYAIKPLIAGLIPHRIVQRLRIRKYGKSGKKRHIWGAGR